ncbi:MAG: RNA polymerase sigma-70 factor [Massilibacteroides sp.]|nr:RNA polymerase sigma-70 factor [Massilibacteroides sp.]MDD3061235.1 RNA polymerase sigma-70 factor [Massilibacteroides sp.]MDD4115680.1 RNA polymerase sigma-70 factor [Massilibacteroides sp.]MDD4661296.1 RNA polymerase sigma-70 factor [Massilibacteroides sp.]
MYLNDEDIISGLKRGDEKAYRYLYEHLYKILCVFAVKWAKDDYIAETIVGDVYLSVWQQRDKLNIQQSLRSYLLKAVYNRCLNYIDYQKRQDLLKDNIYKEFQEENGIETPLSKLMMEEMESKLNECIGMMPPITKQVFCLSRFNNLKYNEIAELLNISPDVVKYHIKSALKRLRNDLKDFMTEWIILFFFMCQ